jgi:SAM-dependent methyltransferase
MEIPAAGNTGLLKYHPMNNPLTIAPELPSHTASADWFATQYLQLRKNEGRVYTDKEVSQLPDVDPFHIYYEEWQVRKQSCNRLVKYLGQKQKALTILEIGCGNGWLTSKLATVENAIVTGADINTYELDQANRVFGNKNNISFVYGGPDNEIFDGQVFDVIVFAASAQYFPSLKQILNKALQHITLQGEIHIVDTHLYKHESVEAAAKRTTQYFTSIGFPEMGDYYFHHCIDDIKIFNHRILHDPNGWMNTFSIHKNPFYHLIITDRY